MGKKKLSDEKREEIRKMYYDGVPIKDIAKKINKSYEATRSIINYNGEKIVRFSPRKRPAGGITFEMIAQVKSTMQIGDRMVVNLVEDERGKLERRLRRCRVTGIYRNLFTVQVGRQTIAYKYVDLIMRKEIKYDKKRRSA